jgi:hypothetical protein
LTDPITVTLSSNVTVPDWYHMIQYEVMDNGTGIAAGAVSRDTQQVNIMVPLPHVYGPHSISARVRPYNSETDRGDWTIARPEPVCVWVGGDLPDTINCQVFGFPEHLEISTASPDILVISTETPIIIVRPDNANSIGKPSAADCAAYTSQSSCQLAGCSWNYGSCVVNP